MLKSIRILLSIVGNYGYEIWQIEVKQTFPNGSLDESIFMRQPYSFIEKGKPHILCKLKDLFMDESKLLGHGTIASTMRSCLLVLRNVLMSLVCTKSGMGIKWCFWYYM